MAAGWIVPSLGCSQAECVSILTHNIRGLNFEGTGVTERTLFRVLQLPRIISLSFRRCPAINLVQLSTVFTNVGLFSKGPSATAVRFASRDTLQYLDVSNIEWWDLHSLHDTFRQVATVLFPNIVSIKPPTCAACAGSIVAADAKLPRYCTWDATDRTVDEAATRLCWCCLKSARCEQCGGFFEEVMRESYSGGRGLVRTKCGVCIQTTLFSCHSCVLAEPPKCGDAACTELICRTCIDRIAETPEGKLCAGCGVVLCVMHIPPSEVYCKGQWWVYRERHCSVCMLNRPTCDTCGMLAHVERREPHKIVSHVAQIVRETLG
ncbi:hypothetical protein M427DRAFT_56782 [Gonapodya prolifera JEL478]|uniref:Uncharacterized protein n=1 Tax=Gonapodya prolifera (strain JEL478) TaxID=1344416 RepID=A0A139AFA4_GONPJ|nr:hypothetical protein M427DRAFT_56782 [Gonapodya prolifera JEL478]|eukprot:KXS15438.1 hypothetical protein M427DRAFT_56782 [Gonapodya prolifera JEL478]